MSNDPYIDALKAEIADLKTENRMLQTQLIKKQEVHLKLFGLLVDALKTVGEI